jgi:eukaryotic-like serine/threonine-protein kinase
MTGCSSDMVLAQLLDEQLNEVEQSSIAEHVETCVRCQERLKALTSQASGVIDWESFDRLSSDPALTMDYLRYGIPAPPFLNKNLDTNKPCRRSARSVSESDLPEVEGYEILAELGHGGMGVVYKAYQQRLSRLVALKMIRAGSLAKPEDLARFRIEAEAVAKLCHPNIIQIFDIGEAGNLPFVALELLEGGSLDAFLKSTPQPAKASAQLLATMARAIHAAHQAGIIHRDLKPSNVLFGTDGTPKITDFGLAKRLEEEGYTETGQVLGSPSYIPPEQAQGRAKEVGPAADVYALGAILYEMLTGRPPFKGASPLETVMQVLNEDPVPPSRLQPQIPRDLETICLKCLAKEPHKRYPSALALVDDLDRYVSDRPIHARPTPLLERGLKWVRRRPTMSSLLAVGCLIASMAAASWLRMDAARRQRDAAVRTWGEPALTKARDDLFDGRFPIEELSRLVHVTESRPRLGDLRSRAQDLLDQVYRRHDEKLALDTARDSLRKFRGLRDDAFFQDARITSIDHRSSVEAVRETTGSALEIFASPGRRREEWSMAPLPESLSEQERDEVARGCYEMLMVLAEAVAEPLQGESPTGQARLALQILERAMRLCDRPTHAYHLKRAACLERAGDRQGAQQQRTAAEQIQPDGAFDHFLSGLEQHKRGNLTQAKRHFNRALEAQPKHFWAQCLLAICELNSRPANPSEAKAHLAGCLQSHPELSWLYLLRALASGQLGKISNRTDAQSLFDAAESDFHEAIKRDRAGRFRYALLANRGLVRFESRKLDLAIADLEEAIKLDPRQLSAHVTLAQIHRQQHALDLALSELNRAIELEPAMAPLYRTRACWNQERPRVTPEIRAQVIADLERAIRLDVPNSRELAKDHAEMARLLLVDKQFQRALDACDLALQIDPDDPEVHRWRIGALLELSRTKDAIEACDAYLHAGRSSADVLGLRGLAKARRNDFVGAIEDYTLALAIQPKSPLVRSRRGWAYLVSGAPQLALRDFEEAVRVDPSSGDAYSGRGSAHIALGHTRQAVADAEESLRHGESDVRLLYSAARVLALAAESSREVPNHAGLSDTALTQSQRERAIALLGQAVERTIPQERAAFWTDVVQSDHAFTAIHRLSAYARIGTAVALPRSK